MAAFNSRNPATGEVILTQESFDPAKVPALVKSAREAQKNTWSVLSFKQRSQYLSRGRAYLMSHVDEIAAAISKNNGKPLVESLAAEVVPMIQTFSFAIKKTERILRDQPVKIGMALPTKRAYISHEPLGVIGIISPWNYPLSTPLAEIILGLMAGNAIILKPSDVTGLVNEQIKKIVDAMQLPDGIFNMLDGGGDVGAALAKSTVDRVIVTGSVGTGKKVMAAACENLTPVTLELGGKDSMIVLEDANIDIASSGAVAGGFYNAGQTCCSVERLLLHESIAEEFLKQFKEKIAKLRIGESRGFENDLGPITFEGQKKTYFHQLQDHLSHGGKTLSGDTSFDGKAPFMKPLVVQGQDDREFWNEETFGPVVAVKTFKTDEEAAVINNQTGFGLTALVWSKDNKRAQKLAKSLHVGTVVINDAPFTNAVSALPWGGRGASGFGRVHGEMGLKELCHAKVVAYDFAGQQKQFWWFPYSKSQYDFLKNYAVLLETPNIIKKIKSLWILIKNFRGMGPRI